MVVPINIVMGPFSPSNDFQCFFLLHALFSYVSWTDKKLSVNLKKSTYFAFCFEFDVTMWEYILNNSRYT